MSSSKTENMSKMDSNEQPQKKILTADNKDVKDREEKRREIDKLSKSKEREREKEKDRRRERRDDKDRNKNKEKDKTRERDRDKERVREKEKEREERKGEGDASINLTGSTNSNGEVEISIEETNKIRASLGLKPLKITDDKTSNKEQEKEKQKKKEQGEKETKSLLLKDKLNKVKKQREYLSNVTGKSLGEELEEEDDDAVAWINKSRTLHENQVKKEKELAEKRAKILEEQDEAEDDDMYSSKDLKGIKIGHKIDRLLEQNEEQVILTFDDTLVLKDANTINNEESQLINLQIKEKEISERNKDRLKKKPTYDAYSDERQEILPQYNDPKAPDAFVLDEDGMVDLEVKTRQDWLKSRKEIAGKNLYSLDSEKTATSEFYTQQEMVKFKKVSNQKKKKKIRSKEKKTRTGFTCGSFYWIRSWLKK